MTSHCHVLFALFCVTCLAAILLVVPSEADACTPPPSGAHGVQLFDDDAEIPADGAIAFGVDGSDDPLEIEVVEKEGEPIDGGYESVPLEMYTDSQPWLDCPYEVARYVIVWKPDEPFVSYEDYQVEITALGMDGQSETTSASFVAGDQTELPGPQLVDEQLEVASEGEDYDCCSCDQCIGACCESDSNRYCWFTSEVDRPRVDAELDVGVEDHQLMVRVLDDDGEVVHTDWGAATTPHLVYESNDDGPYCMTVEVEQLADGEIAETNEVCVEADWQEFGTVDLDPSTPEICNGDPADEADPGGDVGAAADEDADDAVADGCGCSVATGSVPTAALALILLAVWAMRREPRGNGTEMKCHKHP